MTRCRVCANFILGARLKALPGVSLCVVCAQEPYTRPGASAFPQGGFTLLTEQTEAPVLRLAEPERKAEERAEHSMYRQIEGLEEVDFTP